MEEETDNLKKAEQLAQRIEEANKKAEELVKKNEELLTKSILGGRSLNTPVQAPVESEKDRINRQFAGTGLKII